MATLRLGEGMERPGEGQRWVPSAGVRASRRAPSSSLGQALWALLRMRDAIDGIKKIPHPEEAAERLSRRTHRADPAHARSQGWRKTRQQESFVWCVPPECRSAPLRLRPLSSKPSRTAGHLPIWTWSPLALYIFPLCAIAEPSDHRVVIPTPAGKLGQVILIRRERNVQPCYGRE
jgi:hypothetical protein